MKYDLCIIITEVMIPGQPLFEITSREANTISLNSHFSQMQMFFNQIIPRGLPRGFLIISPESGEMSVE